MSGMVFAAKKQFYHLTDSLADDRLRLHLWRIDAISPIEPNIEIALFLKSPKVSLNRGEVDISTDWKCFKHLPDAGILKLPDDSGNLQFGLGKTWSRWQ